MSNLVQVVAPSGIGGVIMGQFGTYPMATDGSYTIDSRDAPSLLADGFSYVKMGNTTYTTPKAPAAAAAAAIIASAAISNGAVAIAASPDVMRPVEVIWHAGAAAITAGTLTVNYTGNDGVATSDVISLVSALNTTNTAFLSKGAIAVASASVAGLVGGGTTFLYASTDANLSLPVAGGAIDISVSREYDAGATVAVGALLTNVLASITPTNAPNATRTYSFFYSFTSPVS